MGAACRSAAPRSPTAPSVRDRVSSIDGFEFDVAQYYPSLMASTPRMHEYPHGFTVETEFSSQPCSHQPCGPSLLERQLASQAQGVAEEFAECCVCFEPLCAEQCCMLFHNGRRACRHLLHRRCGEAMGGRTGVFLSQQCPECRQSFDELRVLPILDQGHLRQWFDAVDVEGNGQLSQWEVIQVLKAQYWLDWRKLEQKVEELWVQWDLDGNGSLSFDEIVAKGGLYEYVAREAQQAEVYCFDDTRSAEERVPSLKDTAEWFSFWDEDGNGTLDILEVHRALVKTFRLGDDTCQINSMKENLYAVWGMFDVDGSGVISYEEFTMPQGLGEALLASLTMTGQHGG